MQYIDIHSHLNFKDFDEDRHEVISRAKENELGMINIGTCLRTSREVVDLAYNNENMWATIGLHPINTPEEPKFLAEEFEEILKIDQSQAKPKIVGVGECGLDYFHLKGETEEERDREKEIQAKSFKDQIDFAVKYDLPIMIHCRDAYEDVLKILKEKKDELSQSDESEKLRGNIHFYAGTVEQAQQFLDLDFTISFTGVITFAEQYKELVEFVPLDKLHGETDSPYVAPVPYRGQRCEPNYTIEVIKKMAEIKGVKLEELKKQLVLNAKNTFNLE